MKRKISKQDYEIKKCLCVSEILEGLAAEDPKFGRIFRDLNKIVDIELRSKYVIKEEIDQNETK